MCNLPLISQAVPDCRVLYDMEEGKLYCRNAEGELLPGIPSNKPMADTVYVGKSSTITALHMAAMAVPAATCVLLENAGGILCYNRRGKPNRLLH